MKAFYDSVRASFGPLAPNQVHGFEILLKASSDLPLRHRAYILATAWHETGPAKSNLHMTPRKEIWGPTAQQKKYEGKKELGNTVRGDGKRFMGRGYVQLTGRVNYQKASNLVGRDLVANPDLALDAAIAAKVMAHGMTNGWFTGKKMADYSDYKEMRRVVNRMDKADLIASYAQKFEVALYAIVEPVAAPEPKPPVVVTPVPPPPETPAAPPKKPEPKPGANIAGWILAAIGALIAAAAAFIARGGN